MPRHHIQSQHTALSHRRRQDLDPVAIRIADEIDAHLFILETDAAHRLVFLMSSLEVVRAHREMEFIFAEIVRFLADVDPSELEFVLRLAAIGKIGERKARPLELAGRLEAESLFIEFQAEL